jgi:hypothetical protein
VRVETREIPSSRICARWRVRENSHGEKTLHLVSSTLDWKRLGMWWRQMSVPSWIQWATFRSKVRTETLTFGYVVAWRSKQGKGM